MSSNLEYLRQRARELATQQPEAQSRFAITPDQGRLVAQARPEEGGGKSRFSKLVSGIGRLTPRPVKDAAKAAASASRFAFSGEQAINLVTPGDQGTNLRREIEKVPVAGGVLGTAFDVATAPATLATVGMGGPGGALLSGLAKSGKVGRITAGLLAPVSKSPQFQSRLFAETVLGTGATYAQQKAAEEGAPLPLQLGAAVLGGAVALGVARAGQGAAMTFTRDASKRVAQEYGYELGHRTFAFDLLPGKVMYDRIKGTENEFVKATQGTDLINPSLSVESEIGKNRLVLATQTSIGRQAGELVVGSVFDPYHKGAGIAAGKGGRLFNIADDGSIINVQAKREGVSTKWGDLFESLNPADDYHLSNEQLNLLNDIHQMTDELTELAVDHGLMKPPEAPEVLGKLYAPRVVRGIRNAEIKGRTNSLLARVYDTMDEATAAGVKYENDPATVYRMYAQSVYKGIAEKQFDELMQPLLVNPKDVLRKTHPGLVVRLDKASKGVVDARRAIQLERRETIQAVARAEGEAGEVFRSGQVRAEMPSPKGRKGTGTPAPLSKMTQKQLTAAQFEWHAARKAYTEELNKLLKGPKEHLPAKAFEDLPNYTFGNTPDELIEVGRWKGSFLQSNADYQKLVDEVNVMSGRAYPPKVGRISAGFADMSNDVRFASAIGDLAMPFIHGLPLFGQNPLLWAKMATKHFQGFLDPSFAGRYVRENLTDIQEMVQNGIPIGDVEMMLGPKTGRGLIISPAAKAFGETAVGRQSLGRLMKAYDTGITASRLMLWKSLKPVWDGAPEDLARYVRNMTGGLDTAALGIGPNQRNLESTWLAFSPRLMRSTLALVGMATNPSTPEGRQAARSLLGLAAFGATAAVTTNIGIGLALGESEDEIKARIEETMNPLGGRKFLGVNINDQWIGVGGQVRSVSQFVAKALAEPSGFATANAVENPLINFYMGKGAVGTRILAGGIEAATGERVNILPFEQIDSVPDLVKNFDTALLPFAVQGVLEAESLSTFDKAAMFGVSFGGLRVTAETASQALNDEAVKRYSKPWGELTGREQQELERDRPDLMERRDTERRQWGDREARQKQAMLDDAERRRLTGERMLADAVSKNLITMDQFRDEIKALGRDSSNIKRAVLGDIDHNTTDPNKQALSQWYDLYDQAKVPGTEIVNWDLHDQLEAELYQKLSPEQQTFIDQRRRLLHSPEVQGYFDNEETIRDSGYYDTVDAAFERMKGALPQGINRYSDLIKAINAATIAEDLSTTRRLSALRNRIDSLASTQKRVLRFRNPALDSALVQNGRVSNKVQYTRK